MKNRLANKQTNKQETHIYTHTYAHTYIAKRFWGSLHTPEMMAWQGPLCPRLGFLLAPDSTPRNPEAGRGGPFLFGLGGGQSPGGGARLGAQETPQHGHGAEEELAAAQGTARVIAGEDGFRSLVDGLVWGHTGKTISRHGILYTVSVHLKVSHFGDQ